MRHAGARCLEGSEVPRETGDHEFIPSQESGDLMVTGPAGGMGWAKLKV